MSKNNMQNMTSLDLRRMQFIELEILKEVDRICRVNNIRYSLGYGSLLGAIRHKGFIPWDDDADILMLREEYEKFKKVSLNQLNKEKFFFQDHKTDNNYRWGYAKIRRLGTTYIREGQEHIKCKNGVFIDIFPLDDIPSCRFLQVMQDIWCYILRKVLWSEVGKYHEKNRLKKAIYKIISRVPKEWVFGCEHKMMKTYGSKNVRCLLFPAPGKHTKGKKKNKYKNNIYGFNKEWLTDLIEVEFEGNKFWATKAFDECLKYLYGEYLELPPKEERTGHANASYYEF